MLPLGQCCAQLLWKRQTLLDFGYNLSKVPLLCDNESAIRMADNSVEHSHTKHIDIRHHFLREHQQKGDIEVYHISTENQLANIFTKSYAFPVRAGGRRKGRLTAHRKDSG